MVHDPVALSCVIAGVTFLGFWLQVRFGWARRFGASLLIILFGAVLGNSRIVAQASPVYDAITGPVTSLAIVWLLVAVDLRSIRAAGPRILGGFAIAVTATCIGAATASLLLGGAFPGEAWKLAGVMTGTYSGGSLNFVAVGREVGLPETLFSAAAAADNVLTAVWMGATLLLPVWLRGHYPMRPRTLAPDTANPTSPAGPTNSINPVAPPAAKRSAQDSTRARPTTPTNPFLDVAELRIVDVLALLTIGFAILLAARAMGELAPAVPTVIWITTLALVAGQIRVVANLAGALQLGLLALNLFFVIIGIGSRVAEIFRVGPEVFWYTAIVVGVHGSLTFGVARLVRLDVETAAVASQAAVGGPSSAVALAAARGWPDLALPGLLVGLLGYAVGNYAGLGIAALVRSALGG